jgi:hypothetical protein
VEKGTEYVPPASLPMGENSHFFSARRGFKLQRAAISEPFPSRRGKVPTVYVTEVLNDQFCGGLRISFDGFFVDFRNWKYRVADWGAAGALRGSTTSRVAQ